MYAPDDTDEQQASEEQVAGIAAPLTVDKETIANRSGLSPLSPYARCISSNAPFESCEKSPP
jgi:hypothetical protein